MKRTFVAMALAVALAPAIQAQDMVAVSWAGDVYTIDSSTGAGSLVVNAGNYSFNSMAKRSDGKLFTADAFGNNHNVYEIDPASGTATFVAVVPLTAVRALAFGPGDVLYAINDVGSSAPLDFLYTVDLAAGTVQQVGSTGYLGVQGLTWANGTLYGWEVGTTGSGDGLITIDPATGTGKDVDPSTPGTSVDVQCLTTDAQGNLYGGRDQLFAVDITTGALKLIGGSGFSDVRGMEFSGSGGGGPTVYCTTKPPSIAGCQPTIAGPAATASIAAGSGSYDVTCAPVPGGPNPGLLTYTTSGALATPVQTSFGFQCIQTGAGYFQVKPVQFPVGVAGTCSGVYSFDFGAYLAGPNPDPALVAGATVDMQVFYRDPLNNGAANLSNAMSLTLVP